MLDTILFVLIIIIINKILLSLRYLERDPFQIQGQGLLWWKKGYLLVLGHFIWGGD